MSKGVPASSLTLDWPSLMRFKRSLVDPTTKRTEEAWAKMGVEQVHGRARYLLEGNRRRVNYDGLASAVFTIPPVASVGLLESDARAAGLHFRTNWQETSGWFNTRRVGETASGFKVLVEEGSERILGAHLLGPNAAEVINLFAVAIRTGIPGHGLEEVIFAYPTSGSDIRFML